ncbi:MAG: glycine cleavage system protein T [Chloroflexi bacterium]|nr:glycine cleavage system protein T [Chloroflexota bacterium]
MNNLSQYHLSLGARLAPDGIPLDYGDEAAEYAAADQGAILLDRSHEGRILLQGRDRLELVNRMSTNDVSRLALHEGAPTVFINANARILFRVVCFNLPRGLLLISEPGQGEALALLLRRSVFFGDQVAVEDISSETAHFALHGAAVDAAIESLAPATRSIPALGVIEVETDVGNLIIARRKSICGGHWIVIADCDMGAHAHRLLLQSGGTAGLIAAGSLTFNCLRIRSGRPAGLELSSDYIPLEVGLWDEISFSKGCYTGQEIIARMESRGRLAKTLVKVALSSMAPAPAPIYAQGKPAGTLTSSVQAPDGQIHALAALKVGSAQPNTDLTVGADGLPARVVDFAGAQPPFVLEEAARSPGN